VLVLCGRKSTTGASASTSRVVRDGRSMYWGDGVVKGGGGGVGRKTGFFLKVSLYIQCLHRQEIALPLYARGSELPMILPYSRLGDSVSCLCAFARLFSWGCSRGARRSAATFDMELP
jgi:hypothetical protein